MIKIAFISLAANSLLVSGPGTDESPVTPQTYEHQQPNSVSECIEQGYLTDRSSPAGYVIEETDKSDGIAKLLTEHDPDSQPNIKQEKANAERCDLLRTVGVFDPTTGLYHHGLPNKGLSYPFA